MEDGVSDVDHVSSTLLQLPEEIIKIIVDELGYAQLAQLSLVCRDFCRLAQPRLFRTVRFDRPSAKSLVEARRPGQDSPYGLTLLAKNACHISFDVCVTRFGKEEIENIYDETDALLAVIASCKSDRVKTMEIDFTDTRYLEFFETELAPVISRTAISCSRLKLIGCSWTFVKEMLMCMGSTLRSVDWNHDLYSATPSDHIQTATWSSSITLPKLKILEMTDVNIEFLQSEALPRILELVAPSLQYLNLSSEHVDGGYHDILEKSIPFPELISLDCQRVALSIYNYITHSVPKLKNLELGSIGDFLEEESVLGTIPLSVQHFDIFNMTLTSDPVETLLGHMSRLTNLKKLPTLHYREEEDEHVKPDIEPVRDRLLAHFDAIGIESTADERQTLLKVFEINES